MPTLATTRLSPLLRPVIRPDNKLGVAAGLKLAVASTPLTVMENTSDEIASAGSVTSSNAVPPLTRWARDDLRFKTGGVEVPAEPLLPQETLKSDKTQNDEKARCHFILLA